MKAILIIPILLAVAAAALAGSTINPTNRYAWGANLGWMDFRADGTNGVAIGEGVCSGSLYAANVGWIHLGNGAPANGLYYQNTAAAGDYGVNYDGRGNLRGFAWGANIGWISFEALGQPRLDPSTGKLNGYAYGGNVGWISLSNVFALVQTDTLVPSPDTDGDGISDVYELRWTGNLTTMNATTDQDGDGASDLEESLADTNPLDSTDQLRLTAISVTNRGEQTELTWTSQPTRQYQIWTRASLDADSLWLNSVLGLQSPDPGATTTRTMPGSADPQHFYRIQAVPPLSP